MTWNIALIVYLEGTDKYQQVTFTDLKDIPEDFEFKHIIKFKGNVPPAPHTVQEHEQIALLETEFKRFMEKERNARSN